MALMDQPGKAKSHYLVIQVYLLYICFSFGLIPFLFVSTWACRPPYNLTQWCRSNGNGGRRGLRVS